MRAKKTAKMMVIAGTLISINLGLINGVVTPTANAAPLVSANLTLPLLNNPVAVKVELPSVVQPVTDAVSPVVQPVLNPANNPAPQQPNIPSTSPAAESAELSVQSTQPTRQSPVSSESHSNQSSGSKSPVEVIGSFFTSSLPDTLRNLASTIVGKDVSPLPVAISGIIFLITLSVVGAIVYTNNYGGRLMIGQYNLTKFAKAHDLNQMAALIVTAIGLGVVTIFLTLNGL